MCILWYSDCDCLHICVLWRVLELSLCVYDCTFHHTSWCVIPETTFPIWKTDLLSGKYFFKSFSPWSSPQYLRDSLSYKWSSEFCLICVLRSVLSFPSSPPAKLPTLPCDFNFQVLSIFVILPCESTSCYFTDLISYFPKDIRILFLVLALSLFS